MKKITPFIPLAFAIIFPVLFHRQQAGLNILIFNLILLIFLVVIRRLSLVNKLHILVAAGTLLSSVMVVIHGSPVALTVNILSLIILSGLLAAPYMTVLANSFGALLVGAFTSPFEYINEIRTTYGSNAKTAKAFRYVGFLVLPLIVVLIYISIYSASSQYYSRLTDGMMSFFGDFFQAIIEVIDINILLTVLAGLSIGGIMFFSKMPKIFDLPWEKGELSITRERKSHQGNMLALRHEMRSAVYLFVMLNLAIAVMNILDFWYVWINFEWDGGLLKQFVHEGTWLLIFSIGISIVIVLWYFRGNLNFYKNNKPLLFLTRLWIAQNIFLAVSVCIRNFWYLNYFNLAYKRIWVFAFILLVLFGLITVLIKVDKRKSFRYLAIYNSIAAYVVFVMLSFINWDYVIAKFNINRAQKAFFHTDFMVTLDSSTLPVLIMDDETLKKVEVAQSSGIFNFKHSYKSFESYNDELKIRRRLFLEGYPELHWLSWTLADYRTYKKLR